MKKEGFNIDRVRKLFSEKEIDEGTVQVFQKYFPEKIFELEELLPETKQRALHEIIDLRMLKTLPKKCNQFLRINSRKLLNFFKLETGKNMPLILEACTEIGTVKILSF